MNLSLISHKVERKTQGDLQFTQYGMDKMLKNHCVLPAILVKLQQLVITSCLASLENLDGNSVQSV
jgi:hypothetical protein